MSNYNIVVYNNGVEISRFSYLSADKYGYDAWIFGDVVKTLVSRYLDDVLYSGESSACNITVNVEKAVS